MQPAPRVLRLLSTVPGDGSLRFLDRKRRRQIIAALGRRTVAAEGSVSTAVVRSHLLPCVWRRKSA
jgi:hypothetical protein